MANAVAQILFPLNVPEPFDYEIPGGLRLAPGDFVYAPVGRQSRLGVVWSVGEAGTGRKLKAVSERKPAKPLNGEMLEFINWTARYNCASPGLVLRMVLRSHKALDPAPMVTRYEKSASAPKFMTAARARVLALENIWPARAGKLAKAAGVSPGVITGMAKAGILRAAEEPLDPPFEPLDPDRIKRAFPLTCQQQDTAQALSGFVKSSGFQVSLLDGVTGSGKTEVYLETAAEALRQGGQVLILMPEIALTQAGLKRFGAAFAAIPARWHSGLSDAERRRVWREVARGRAKLVIGARSALYLPFPDLRLIVIDEEHDTSYKQEEGVIYNARDMAVVRARIAGASVILASATPSLETLANVRNQRYHWLKLPERPGAAVMPDVELIDLKKETLETGRYLSQSLRTAIAHTLDRNEQVLLYLNRRGYAPLIICRVCGERLKSPDTDSWLVAHRRTGKAVCHHTGFSMPMPTTCPECKSADSLHPVGAGVERVAEEAQGYCPNAHVEILSSDTAENPEQVFALMARMAAGEIDILVGTQMVVKGHNFPNLTLVGVVDGDMALAGGDLRASERTYQTLVQVAGRAGRADKPGKALIQTHMPEHNALAAFAAAGREGFIEAELQARELFGLPPFGRLAGVIISAPDAANADAFARAFLGAAPRADGIEILGPSEAPIAILRGRHRRRLLVKSAPDINLSAYMRTWKQRLHPKGKTKIRIDIDPLSFL